MANSNPVGSLPGPRDNWLFLLHGSIDNFGRSLPESEDTSQEAIGAFYVKKRVK